MKRDGIAGIICKNNSQISYRYQANGLEKVEETVITKEMIVSV